MGIFALAADERVANVRCTEDSLAVELMDGRTIVVPLAWYPACCVPRPTKEAAGEFPAVVMASTGLTWMKT